MRKKRLLFIQTQAENAGAQEISRLLGEYFSSKGYDVSHVFLYRKTSAFDDLPHVFFCAEERPTSLKQLFILLRHLDRTLARLQPDTVLTFQHYGNIIGGLAAWHNAVPRIIANQLSAPPTMHIAVRLLDGLMGQFGLFTRIVVNSADTLRAYSRWPRRYRQRLVRIDHGFADKTAGISKEAARQRWHLPQDKPVLGCVARLHPLKRLDTAIAMLPDHPEWHMAFAGQGEERAALEQLSKDMQVTDRVHFLGELPPDDIGIFLAALDVFVFPSCAETFGLAAVEAAQAGVPVVSSDLPVLREVLADTDGNPCAVFVADHSPQGFGDAVAMLLAHPEHRDALRMRAQGLKERYAFRTMAESYARLIEDTEGKTPAPSAAS